MKFNGGVMLAADTLGLLVLILYLSLYPWPGSYGGLAKLRGLTRLHAVGNTTVVGGSGDVADIHHINHVLDDLS